MIDKKLGGAMAPFGSFLATLLVPERVSPHLILKGFDNTLTSRITIEDFIY